VPEPYQFKGAFVSCTTTPCIAAIGVDIMAPMNLSSTCCDVVILGQQLTGGIERHAIGPCSAIAALSLARDQIKGRVPTGIRIVDFRVQQPPSRSIVSPNAAPGTVSKKVCRMIDRL
jgi:hypothetical protein